MSITAKRPSPRWTTMRPHEGQQAYYQSQARFNVVPAGRRSGKTELAKRRLVRRAVARVLDTNPQFHNGRFFAAAPTRDQAKRLYWEDLKLLVPKQYLAGKPKEGELIIVLKNKVEIYVIGMDKPQRIEGSPWDGGILDEYGDMKQEAWMQNVFPALADRQGWCDLVGVPEGRNHYYDRWLEALACTDGSMRGHHWKSAEILPASEIARAKQYLDELSFKQEFEAEFAEFAGQCYYSFNENEHCSTLAYDPDQPLIFCFDFNVSPGVAAVIQEQVIPGSFEYIPNPSKYGRDAKSWNKALNEQGLIRIPATGTGIIGEVHIPSNSNTPAVCRRLIQDWGDHRGKILIYGDATGGARGTAKVSGSDWELIEQAMYGHFGDDRVFFEVPNSNPSERGRINAVNARLKAIDGTVRLAIDPAQAKMVVKDFEGVRLLEGGSGEIDKKKDRMLSHISDAVGYYIAREFPIHEDEVGTLPMAGRY